MSTYQLSQLDALEAEAIHICREVAAEFEHPVLMFSGGKDSLVMLRLAQKAFHPAGIPFAVLHVDTGHICRNRDVHVASSRAKWRRRSCRQPSTLLGNERGNVAARI